MSSAAGVREPGDWFTAEAAVPPDVAVLNFVVQYYEHFDNNYGLDYKAAVQFDSHGRCDTVRCLPAGLLTCINWCSVSQPSLPSKFVVPLLGYLQTLMASAGRGRMTKLSAEKS